MSLQKPRPKVVCISHFLWLIHDPQANKLRLRLGKARPRMEGFKLWRTGDGLRFLNLLRLRNSVVRLIGLGPARRRRSLKSWGHYLEHLRTSLLRLLLFFCGRGKAAGEESRPFSPGAFLNVPFCLFSSCWLRRSWRAFVLALRALS